MQALRQPQPVTPAVTALSLSETPPQALTFSTPQVSVPIVPAATASYRTAPHNIAGETAAAVSDMMTLPQSYFYTVADFWFKENQPWIPILDHDRIQGALHALPSPVSHIPDVVLRAVIALEIAYSSQAICLGYKGRRRLSLYLRSQVLVEAMAKPSLDSIQALFIIAILDYGSDDIPSTFSIMAMCRRMGEHIGTFRQLLKRIESQSPAQVGPPARETFQSDDSAIALTWGVLALDAVSSLGVSWRDVSAALVDHLSGVAYLTTPDFRDSFRAHVHLAAIGLQPVHEFFFAYAKGEHHVLDETTLTVTEEMYRNLISYDHGLPPSGYTILADGVVDFDINHIFTRLLSNAATIMIYQRYVVDVSSNTHLARERCLGSYSNIIDIVRNISDADAEINSPLFASFLCVAARFKLSLDRSLGQDREPLFDMLMHGLNMCGRRWPLARRLDIVLRAAIVEVDSGVPSGLPEEFWDLKESGLDMSEVMKKWVHDYKPSLYVGSLNGPYV